MTSPGLLLIAAWVVSGYTGAGLLIVKGYVTELGSCAIFAGIGLLLPAVLGPLLLVYGIYVPSKISRGKK